MGGKTRWWTIVAGALLGGLLTLVAGMPHLIDGGNVQAQAPLPCPPPPASPDVPPAPVPCEEEVEEDEPTLPGEVCLQLSADPEDLVAPGETITYAISVYNGGYSRIKNLRIFVPIDPTSLSLLEMTSSQGYAWVREILSDGVAIQIDYLDNDEEIDIALRLLVQDTAEADFRVTERVSMTWPALAPGRQVLSNQLDLGAESETGPDSPAPLLVDGRELPARVTLSYDGFASEEVVSLWYDQPGGSTVPLGEMRADEQGRLEVALAVDTLAAGTYGMVAYGHCSDVTAAGALTLEGR